MRPVPAATQDASGTSSIAASTSADARDPWQIALWSGVMPWIPATVHARAGAEQDLDELDAVEARRAVERPIEVAAPFDEQLDAGSIDAELVAERRSEHVGLGDLAERAITSRASPTVTAPGLLVSDSGSADAVRGGGETARIERGRRRRLASPH